MNVHEEAPKDNADNVNLWMSKAKTYAEREHNIYLADDDEFWEAVRAYWNYNVDPETAVNNVISYYF